MQLELIMKRETEMNLKDRLAEAEKRMVTACLTCPLPDCEPSINCQLNKAKVAAKNLSKKLKGARKRMEHARIEMVAAPQYAYEVSFDVGNEKVLRIGHCPENVLACHDSMGRKAISATLVSDLPLERKQLCKSS
jgi:hypothetical protein